jgi:hypothetical protein
MEEALRSYSTAKSNLSTAASGVSSANSSLLSAASQLKSAIDKEVADEQSTAATNTGVKAA